MPRYLPHRLLLAPLLAGFVAATAAGSATAHELPRERTILVEVSAERVEAMVVYQEPPGRPVEFLLGRFDLDGDGRLDGPEAEAAGEEWAPRALQGLVFEAGDERLEPDEPKVKFRPEHNGALSAALLLSWDRPALEPGEARTVRVRRKSDAARFATLVSFQIAPGLDVADTPAETDARRTGPFELTPGDARAVSATRPE